MNYVQSHKDEKGSILVISVVILMLLSIIGTAAFRTTNIELHIARNDKIYNMNLFQAESAAMEAAQSLWNETDILSLESLSNATHEGWVHFDLPDSDVLKTVNWTSLNSRNCTGLNSTDVRYTADYRGIDKGSSLDMSSSRSHSFDLYGRSADNGGNVVIQIGFKKRF